MGSPGASFVRALHRELDGWVARGLISAGQRAQIEAAYPPPRVTRAWWVTVLATLGALLMGTGVILTVAANWRALGDPVKLGLLVALMLGANGLAYHLRFGREQVRLGNALFLLGTLLYGALLFFVAQALQLPADLPLLPLLWALGVAPLAYALPLPGLLHVALFGALTAFALQVLRWDVPDPAQLFALYSLLGLSAFAAGEAHARSPRWQHLDGPYGAWGAPLLLLATYLASFAAPWELPSHPTRTPGLLPLLMTGTGILAVALTWHLGRERHDRLAALLLGVPLVLDLLVLWVPGALHSRGAGSPPGAALTNLLLLGLSLGLLALGERQERPGWINLGLLGLGALILTRYLDVFSRLLDTGLLFLTSGALLFALGWLLERGRRSLRGRMRRA